MSVLVCKSVWFSYYSAKSHSQVTITVHDLMITISAYWYPFLIGHSFVTIYLLTIYFWK